MLSIGTACLTFSNPLDRLAADALCGRIWRDQLRMICFEVEKLLIQLVVLPIRKLRLGLDVVEAVVPTDRVSQVINPLLHVCHATGYRPHCRSF